MTERFKTTIFLVLAIFLTTVSVFVPAVPFCADGPPVAGGQAGVYRLSTTVMGTDLKMTISGVDERTANAAFAAAVKEMERIEQEMSEWRDGTDVSEINRLAGIRPVKVPSELIKMVSSAIVVSELTHGAFDISWAAMRGVWDFRPGHERVPDKAEVAQRLKLVDYRDIVVDPAKSTIFLKRKGMAIGLGAIAKGYAVDKAMEKFVKAGVRNAIIRAGGDMRVQGTDENGMPWVIGIKNPRKRNTLIAKLPVSNISVSTSGDYERFFIKDGVLYHHIMDPRTGYPARGCQSVTILAPDTMTSDALSTSVFVLGPKKGMELIRKLPGVEGLIVDAEGKVTASNGITLKNAPTAPGKKGGR